MMNDFIPAARPLIGDEEREAVDRVLRSGVLAQGPEVAAFEREFADHFELGRPCVVAISRILTCSPISRTNTSPSVPIEPASRTSWQASGMSMKKRSTSGWVTVIGPPLCICAANACTTEPREPSTLPKRTETYRPGWVRAKSAVSRSATRLLWPRMPVSTLTSTTPACAPARKSARTSSRCTRNADPRPTPWYPASRCLHSASMRSSQ